MSALFLVCSLRVGTRMYRAEPSRRDCPRFQGIDSPMFPRPTKWHFLHFMEWFFSLMSFLWFITMFIIVVMVTGACAWGHGALWGSHTFSGIAHACSGALYCLAAGLKCIHPGPVRWLTPFWAKEQRDSNHLDDLFKAFQISERWSSTEECYFISFISSQRPWSLGSLTKWLK